MKTATLQIEVDYAPGPAEFADAKATLDATAEYLAANGLLSGEGPAEVEQWRYRTTRRG